MLLWSRPLHTCKWTCTHFVFMLHTHICSIVHSMYTLHNTRPRPCTQSRKQGEWGGWVHPPRWATLGFWAIHSECKCTLISMIRVYSPDLYIVHCVLCEPLAAVMGSTATSTTREAWGSTTVRDGCNHKYFIHLVCIGEVVIANYILQHQKFVLVVCIT